MKKIIMLFMLLALSVGILSCGGGGAGSADTPNGENPGLPSVVRLSPSHFIAQTNSYIYLHAQVFDGNGAAVKGVAVTFTNLSDPFGKITSAVLRTLGIHKAATLSTTVAKTNGLGIATVKITSTSSGFATIQAEVNKGAGLVRDRKTVFFTETIGSTTPPPPTITLSVVPPDFNLLKTTNDNQRTIKALVLDGFGVPLVGRSVTFGSDLPNEVTFTPATPVLTDTDGVASVTLTVNPSIIANLERVLNITAGADTDNNGTIDTAGMITLFLEPVTVTDNNIAVSAIPSVVPLNGTSTISASVTLSSGGPVPDGSTISFATTCGRVTDFAQTTNGEATATFTAPSGLPSGPCTVTASIAGAKNSTDVTVTPNPSVFPSSQTVNGAPGGTVTYTVFGGVPPYEVFTSNQTFTPIPDSGIPSGGTFTVTVPPNTPATSVTFTVRDSIGNTVPAALVIIFNATDFYLLPVGATIPVSGSMTFEIFGGTSPFEIFWNNPIIDIIYDTSVDPRSFTVIGDSAGSVTITISDKDGRTTTANVTVQ